ncbi:MAG TPA: PaaX family transcriptional regulator C-terminal domain-containing protein [Nocardioidaceae bacterium]
MSIARTDPNNAFQPRALIVTVYGLYARDATGWLSVSALIRLMAELGVDEAAVRSSISRLKRRGILQARARDGAAGYALSGTARSLLDSGDRRIFERPRAAPGEAWLLAVFSVPESERSRRHALRSRLTWLGFGTVAAGVWIAPAHLEAETRDALERDDLTAYVDLFRADYLDFGKVGEQVRTWWDLTGLQGLYDDFLSAYGPVLTRWRRRRATSGTSADADAFADYVSTLTAWRRLPYLDPGLPDDVLPKGWSGARAADLFFDLRDRLAEPAAAFVTTVR